MGAGRGIKVIPAQIPTGEVTDVPIQLGLICLTRSLSGLAAEAALAEEVGFDTIGVADSQSLFRELYVSLAVVARETRRVRLGPAVTNPITRHPAVAASAIASIDELAPGRVFYGVGSGDSAVYNLHEPPVRLGGLRETLVTMRGLLQGQFIEHRGKQIHAKWIERPVPIYIAAEGPKTLELAGELADGVFIGTGITPEVIEDSLARVAAGARRAGRDPATIDTWVLARCNLAASRAEAIAPIRMELASSAHHVFRFTFEGKHVPDDLVDRIRWVQERYQPAAHEQLGPSPNAQLVDQAGITDWLADRFALIGTPEEVAEKLRRIGAAGVQNVMITGFVDDRPELIRRLGREVLPRARD